MGQLEALVGDYGALRGVCRPNTASPEP